MERGDDARAMGESKAMVCSVTEKGNDYFAVHFWERLFRKLLLDLEQNSDYFATGSGYWALNKSNDYFATCHFLHK